MKSIHERVRATLAKQAAQREKAEQVANNRRFSAQVAAETRIEKGIQKALVTGVARTKREQRALDIELGIYDSDLPFPGIDE